MILACCQLASIAQDTIPYPDYQEDVFMDMDFDENTMTPSVPRNLHQSIADYQRKQIRQIKNRYTIDLMRNDEVFIVCIPTDDLFLPNDTLFNDQATGILNPLLKLMEDPYMYKIVVAVHTDDTGSELYRRNLSTARIYSVYDWMMDAIDAGRISEDLVIIPYPMGSSDPILSNDTRKNRRANRRLEIYFIPGPKMIELARKNSLK